MKSINPLAKTNLIHDMAMFCFVLWLTVNYAYENYVGHTIYASLCMYVFLAAGAFWLLVKGRFTILGNYYFVAMIIMLMLILVSFFYIPESITTSASRWTYRFFTNIIIAFILINLIQNEKDISLTLKAFVAGGVLIAILFYSLYGADVTEVAGAADDPSSRFGWEFGNVNLLAQKCTFSVVIAYYYSFYSRKKIHSIFYLIIGTLIFSVCLFSGSRKSILVVVFALAFIILSKNSSAGISGKIRIIGGIILLFAVVVIAIMAIPAFNVIEERFMSFVSVFSGGKMTISEVRRMSYIKRGLAQFLHSPFWGNGMNYSEYMFGTYSHNNYVEMLLNFGILGFIIHYYSHFLSLKRALQSTKDRRINVVFISIIIAILVTDIGVVTYYDRNIAILMAVISKYYSELSNKIEKNTTGYRKGEQNG